MQRALLACLVACLAATPASAQPDCGVVRPEPGSGFIIPGSQTYLYQKLATGASLALDLFVQPDAGVHPTVLVVHGGGWTTGSRDAHIGQFLELVTQAGYNWAAIDYRLGQDRREEAAEDVRAALAFLTCHARAFRLDMTRVVILGEDVGADLAAQMASEGRVLAAALVGGVYRDSLPLTRAAVRIVHGGDDREVPASAAQEYCNRLRAQDDVQPGVCEVDLVDGAIHRAENWRPSQWGYKARLVDWLRRIAGPGAARPIKFEPQPVRDVLGPGLHKRLTYHRQTGQTLDVWIPSGAGPHIPVLLVHGGGWEAGDRVTYITPMFRPLAEAGLAWFSIDYRLTPDVSHVEQLQDLRDAIRFVRERAGSFNVDARKLVIVGESASGQMVAQIATEDASLLGVVSFYGVYDFEPMAGNLTPRSAVTRLFGITRLDETSRETLRTFSPIHHVRASQPPMLLIHGTAEGLWGPGQAMAERLKAVGARHKLMALEGAPHGMENWEGDSRWLHYKADVVGWITALAAASR